MTKNTIKIARFHRTSEAGVLKPKIDKVFKFDEIVDAYKYMEANQQIGKIVVSVDNGVK